MSLASYSHPKRVVAVGDLHGDLDALVTILEGLQMIDEVGDWCGDDTVLVLMGDLNDRGPDSIAIMHLVMRLERQAAKAGGALHALLGNHELMAVSGDYRYAHPRDWALTRSYRHGARTGLAAIYSGNSPIAQWIRRRPTLVKVGHALFVHASLDQRVLQLGLENVNPIVQQWIEHMQTGATAPAEQTRWLVDEAGDGPAWQRNLGLGAGRTHAGAHDIRSILRAAKARTVVVGHNPTWAIDHQIAWPHPAFGDAVAVVDTGISETYGGRVSAFEMHGEAWQPHYFERRRPLLAGSLRRATGRWLRATATGGCREWLVRLRRRLGSIPRGVPVGSTS